MLHHEPASHTFLLRIWIEETSHEAGQMSWRGHITHLPDEEQRYVESLEEVACFVRRYVGQGDFS